jgi:hypothetical protein
MMNCDFITLTCEVPIGSMILAIGLASMGISVALFGLAEDVSAWWKTWKEKR